MVFRNWIQSHFAALFFAVRITKKRQQDNEVKQWGDRMAMAGLGNMRSRRILSVVWVAPTTLRSVCSGERYPLHTRINQVGEKANEIVWEKLRRSNYPGNENCTGWTEVL